MPDSTLQLEESYERRFKIRHYIVELGLIVLIIATRPNRQKKSPLQTFGLQRAQNLIKVRYSLEGENRS